MSEIVLITGMQGAGKSTIVADLVSKGYKRYNRDDADTSMIKIHAAVASDLSLKKTDKFVLDNTYVDRESRKGIISIAKKFGIGIRAITLDTSLEDCQYNVCTRMIRKHGSLPTSDEMKKLVQRDNSFVPAVVQYVYRKNFEQPSKDEGFDSVEVQRFVRKSLGGEYSNKALILDYDGCLRETISGDKYPVDPSDIRILPRRAEIIKAYEAKGYILLGVSNQSGVAKGNLTEEMAHKCFQHTNTLLGVNIDYAFCPHSVPPVSCYCRKPSSGLGVAFIERYKLQPSECIFVGDMTSDKTFAARCGFKFVHSSVFFDDIGSTVKKAYINV